MRIEILHVRDSDGGCEHRVIVDGTPVDDVVVETVDPGRGHMLSDWDEYTDDVRKAKDYSPEFRAMVVAERVEARESKYIEEED